MKLVILAAIIAAIFAAIIALIIIYLHYNGKKEESMLVRPERISLDKENDPYVDVISGGTSGNSYYNRFTIEDAKNGLGQIIVVYHYTNWCRYCKEMTPIIDQLMKDFKEASNGAFTGVYIQKNDEDAAQTPGISGYPTIIRYQGGKMRKYNGRARYNDLREWILNPIGPTSSFWPQ